MTTNNNNNKLNGICSACVSMARAMRASEMHRKSNFICKKSNNGYSRRMAHRYSFMVGAIDKSHHIPSFYYYCFAFIRLRQLTLSPSFVPNSNPNPYGKWKFTAKWRPSRIVCFFLSLLCWFDCKCFPPLVSFFFFFSNLYIGDGSNAPSFCVNRCYGSSNRVNVRN